jgi:hypothetical protein
MVPHLCHVASHVVSFGTPSGWPSQMLDIAATSACAERCKQCLGRKKECAGYLGFENKEKKIENKE